ncbi:MAG: glycosyltransferase family 4 protein [Gemmataceae bacterium]|nr:glycosyltransferase family 4 protein [Gemmataceae bacterium]
MRQHTIAHLTASQFHGGPERQMLGLAGALPDCFRTAFLSFAEGGRCEAFLTRARAFGHRAIALQHDTPHFLRMARELSDRLQRLRPDVLCCHGYKSIIFGHRVGRALGIRLVAVSRGWTAESPRVRLYEAIEKRVLRKFDRIVAVSSSQAAKVARAGVAPSALSVIRNAVNVPTNYEVDDTARDFLARRFPVPPTRIVGAAGRLSPEKGFMVLVKAAAQVCASDPSVGFVLWGDGPMRDTLRRAIARHHLEGRVLLEGFHDDVQRFFPSLDVLALPSFTEGLPNVVLESLAVGTPVVATSVGGTPEIVDDGVNGFLVPAGDALAMADRLNVLLNDDRLRQRFGENGRAQAQTDYGFEHQANHYERLFEGLLCPSRQASTAKLATVSPF